MLIVNVASQCGFTRQYAGLEALYQKYKDRNFLILGFPCNQFGGQEPGTEEEIQQFCSLKFNVSFPIMEKVEVNGDKVLPLYEWLKNEKKQLMMTRIKWNFEVRTISVLCMASLILFVIDDRNSCWIKKEM